MFSGDEISARIKADPALVVKGEPASIGDQLRSAFKLLVIDDDWAGALAANSAAGFPALMEKLQTVPQGRRQLLETMLLDRWAQLDPVGGADYFKQLADSNPGDQQADDALANFIRQWGMIDFTAAAAKAEEYGGKTTRRTLREKAKLDPTGFLSWANDHPDINPFSILTSDNPENDFALGRLAELDLDRVLAWSRDVPVEKWRTQLAPALAEKLAKRYPNDAIAWAKGLGDPAATTSALAGVAKALAETNPTRALALLKELGPGNDFPLYATYQEVITKLGLSDPDKALDALEGLPRGQLRSQMMGQALQKLLASDPAKAFALSEKLGTETGGMGFVPGDGNATKTPDDARRMLDLAAKASDSSFRQQVAMVSLMSWLQADQQSLGEYLKSNLDQPMFKDVKAQMGPGLAAMMLESGQAIDPGLAEAVGMKPEMTVQAMAERDPAGAATRLGTVSDPEARTKIIGQIAGSWTDRDRSDALDWADGLASPAEQAAAYKSISGKWMDEDSHRASAWIGSLPAGQPRDAAVSSMVSSVAASDPDLAWQWGLTMSDSAQRTEALSTTARQWQAKDAAAAQEALRSPALSDADRAAIGAALAMPPPKR